MWMDLRADKIADRTSSRLLPCGEKAASISTECAEATRARKKRRTRARRMFSNALVNGISFCTCVILIFVQAMLNEP